MRNVTTKLTQLLMVQCELLFQQGKYDETEPPCIKCLDETKDLLGDTRQHTLRSLNNWALLYFSQGRYEGGEPIYLDCLKKKAVLGDTQPHILISVGSFASLYRSQGRYAEAEALGC